MQILERYNRIMDEAGSICRAMAFSPEDLVGEGFEAADRMRTAAGAEILKMGGGFMIDPLTTDVVLTHDGKRHAFPIIQLKQYIPADVLEKILGGGNRLDYVPRDPKEHIREIISSCADVLDHINTPGGPGNIGEARKKLEEIGDGIEKLIDERIELAGKRAMKPVPADSPAQKPEDARAEETAEAASASKEERTPGAAEGSAAEAPGGVVEITDNAEMSGSDGGGSLDNGSVEGFEEGFEENFEEDTEDAPEETPEEPAETSEKPEETPEEPAETSEEPEKTDFPDTGAADATAGEGAESPFAVTQAALPDPAGKAGAKTAVPEKVVEQTAGASNPPKAVEKTGSIPADRKTEASSSAATPAGKAEDGGKGTDDAAAPVKHASGIPDGVPYIRMNDIAFCYDRLRFREGGRTEYTDIVAAPFGMEEGETRIFFWAVHTRTKHVGNGFGDTRDAAAVFTLDGARYCVKGIVEDGKFRAEFGMPDMGNVKHSPYATDGSDVLAFSDGGMTIRAVPTAMPNGKNTDAEALVLFEDAESGTWADYTSADHKATFMHEGALLEFKGHWLADGDTDFAFAATCDEAAAP